MNILYADCGAQQTCALTETGEMYVFGLSRLFGAVQSRRNNGRNGSASNKRGSGGGNSGRRSNSTGLVTSSGNIVGNDTNGGNNKGTAHFNGGNSNNGTPGGMHSTSNNNGNHGNNSVSVFTPMRMAYFDTIKSLHVGHFACGGTHTVFITRPMAEKATALAKMVSVQNIYDKIAFVLERRRKAMMGEEYVGDPNLSNPSLSGGGGDGGGGGVGGGGEGRGGTETMTNQRLVEEDFRNEPTNNSGGNGGANAIPPVSSLPSLSSMDAPSSSPLLSTLAALDVIGASPFSSAPFSPSPPASPLASPRASPTAFPPASPLASPSALSSSSTLVMKLQRQNELQKSKIVELETEKKEMMKIIANMKTLQSDKQKKAREINAQGMLNNSFVQKDTKDTKENTHTKDGHNVGKTLQQLDSMVSQFQAPSIKQFLLHIKTIVGSLNEQLMDTKNEMNEIKSTNSVLRSCLERAENEKQEKQEIQENQEKQAELQEEEKSVVHSITEEEEAKRTREEEDAVLSAISYPPDSL